MNTRKALRDCILVAALVASCCLPISAERVSRAESGTVPCGDNRTIRVLAVGGELQANSWCNKEVIHRDNTGKVISGKTGQQEREEFQKAKDDERGRRKAQENERALREKQEKDKAAAERVEREARKKFEEQERRRREDAKRAADAKRKKHEHDCRGLGRGAECGRTNPGRHGG